MTSQSLGFQEREHDYIPLRSGLLVSSWTFAELERERRRRTAVDLFAGCGGSSCGAMQAGMNVVAMVEWEPIAALTYCTNLCRYGEMTFHFLTPEDEARMEDVVSREYERDRRKGRISGLFAGNGWISGEPSIPGVQHVIVGDIRRLKGAQLLQWIGLQVGELGCMFGSPPCQGFSTANSNRTSDDPRNDLCFEFARLVVECMPMTIVVENVPEFATSPQFPRFIQILKEGHFEGVEAFERFLEARNGTSGTKQKTKTRFGRKNKRCA